MLCAGERGYNDGDLGVCAGLCLRLNRDMSNKQDSGDIVIRMRPRRPVVRLVLFAGLGIVLLGSSTVASYYVDALWFASLGYSSVFWTRRMPRRFIS